MPNQSLILDMIDWINKHPRSYAEVMEAWRTSCPRLSVWEDAVDAGFVVRRQTPENSELMVYVTDAGRAFLKSHRSEAA